MSNKNQGQENFRTTVMSNRIRGTTKEKYKKYRSGLESDNARYLEHKKVQFEYEKFRVPWVVTHTYLPDFVLPNGIVVETKGRFVSADRRKHIEVRKQHPDLDIRFVFSNSKSKLYKGSKTTYADWCHKNNFKFSDKRIPHEWLKEKPNDSSLSALGSIRSNKRKPK